jgi:predicted CxxxxCH...CXXCH cytochrome family protein
VEGTTISPAFACTFCHLKSTSAFTNGHIDPGPSEVVFGGHAVAGHTPVWDRTAGTCANTHCHAGPGATLPAPRWTRVGQGEAACGGCHGLPPPTAGHPNVGTELTGCSTCHDATMNSDGTVIPPTSGGRHLDGIVEAGGHPAAYSDPTSDAFHAYAANRGLDDCKACHGQNLDGVGGVARGCQACHGDTWKTNCAFCHGGGDNQTGAPPRTVWGKSSDPIRVGAHTAHVTASATHASISCATCHPAPTSATTPGHVDQREIADVSFTGVANTGAAAWNRGTATCSTYCHGVTLLGASNPAPVWTGGPSQATCGACHGAPPDSGQHWHATDAMGSATCADCHGYGYGAGTDPGLHVNGRKDVGGSVLEWIPQWGSCLSACHGYASW